MGRTAARHEPGGTSLERGDVGLSVGGPGFLHLQPGVGFCGLVLYLLLYVVVDERESWSLQRILL